jgi:phage gp37-like protein
MAATLDQIEDAIIDALETTDQFKLIESAGREAPPAAMNYPAAFVFFVGANDTGNNPRPVMDARFDVVITNKNLRGEQVAAQSTYALAETVRDALAGQTLGLETSGVGPFRLSSYEILGANGGVISYVLHFVARVFHPMPA